MGSEDLFHKKRRAKNMSKNRQIERRKSHDRVLIVCEGEKTECLYFSEIRRAHRLASADVKILFKGSAPISVVDGAISIYEEDRDFDFVYCVFDKDDHSTFSQAIHKMNQYNSDKFIPIISIRQFEFWLMLHFTYTTKPYNCSMAMESELSDLISQHLEKSYRYKKGVNGIYSILKELTPVAISNAKHINNLSNEVDRTKSNPYTNVYELVEKMLAMSK